MSRVQGKVVVVTGASAGIGRETALRLARRGATVVAAARDVARLEALATDARADRAVGPDVARAAGAGGVEPVRCDVSVAEDRAALVDTVLQRHGRIDALVNNAGLGWHGTFEDMPRERIEYLYAVNVVGLVDLCRLALPPMLAARSGDIVNVSSMAGYVAYPPFSVYCSTKHAVNGFTDALRREVRFRGVRVHLVLPGPIATEFFPRSAGNGPEPGSAEERFAGFPATWVAESVERCLTRPFPRVVAVPRVFGAGRVVQVSGVRQAVDLATGLFAKAYAARQHARAESPATPVADTRTPATPAPPVAAAENAPTPVAPAGPADTAPIPGTGRTSTRGGR